MLEINDTNMKPGPQTKHNKSSMKMAIKSLVKSNSL